MSEIFLSSFIMCYFFCIRSSSILWTVQKVVHVIAKKIQNIKHGRKKTVRCKKISENVKYGSKWYVIFYKYLSQTFYDSSYWLVICSVLFWNGIVRGTVLYEISYNYIYIIPRFIFTGIWMPCAQKICKNLT